MAGVNRQIIAVQIAAISGLDLTKAKRIVAKFDESFAVPFAKRLSDLHITQIIQTKNPYLYRASNIQTCEELVSRAFNDYVSASVEGYFGPFFEEVALIVSGGDKPPTGGEVDLWLPGEVTPLYVIKSGPKGFNSSSYDKARRDLDSAEARKWQNKVKVEKKIGFAYGRKRTTMKGGIVHLSSRDFWAELSGDPDFYKKLLDVCGVLAPLYLADMKAPLEELLAEAHQSFCKDGAIDWDSVLKLVSG